MGLKDFFATRRASRSEKQIAKAAKKLMNKHIQTAERKHCIDLLEQAGSLVAIRGILGRFTFRVDVGIVDEDEKEIAFKALLRLGPAAIPAIQVFIREETAVYWPLRALTEAAGEDMAVDILLEEIAGITEGFDRDVARKHELVSNLREFENPKVLGTLVKLLEDEAEEIRILAIDGLSVYDGKDIVGHLVPLLGDEEETGRVKQMVLDLLVQRRWNVKRYKRALAANLPEHFWIDDTGVVQRK